MIQYAFGYVAGRTSDSAPLRQSPHETHPYSKVDDSIAMPNQHSHWSG